MRKATFFLLLPILLVLSTISLNAATIRCDHNGNWNATTTWHGDKVPTSTDDVIIGNNNTVTVTANATCASLTLGKNGGPGSGSGTLQINSGVVLSVSGNVTLGVGPRVGTMRFQTAGSGELNMTNSASTLTFTNGTFNGASVIRRAISGAGTWAFSDANTRLVTSAGQSAINVLFKTYPSTNIPTGDSTKAIRRYLSITPSGALTAALRFSYATGELKTLTEANLAAWRYDGTAWVNAGGTDVPASNYVEITGVSTWSDWTAADPSQPLPVQLVSFNAVVNKTNTASNVQLDWATISEVNNFGFYIQRQLSGESDFSTVENGFVAGNGTTLEQHNYSWTDVNVPVGTHSYRIKQVDLDGLESYSSPIEVTINKTMDVKDNSVPSVFQLDQNYPNPFNPTTNITFSVAETNPTTLKVYNVLGSEIATLFDGIAASGRMYTVSFDASKLGNGIYLYKIQSGMNSQVRKMTLIK
jgi:hypothetical protein